MGLLSTLLEPRHLSLEDPTVPLNSAFEVFASQTHTSAGVAVNPTSADRLAAWYGAVNLIAGDIGSLPLKLYQRTDKGRDPQTSNPLYRRLHTQPNQSKMSARTYRAVGMRHLINYGNWYSEILEDRELVLLNPTNTRLVQDEPGAPFYRTGETQRIVPYDQVWHVIGMSWDGHVGISVLQAAREAVALGLSSQDFAAQFYGGGMKQSMILSHPTTLTEPAQERLRSSVTKAGQRSHGVLVLEEDLKATNWQLSAEDAEFLDSQKFNIAQIARYLNLPLHKLRDPNETAYASLVELNQDYAISTLTPWITAIEQSLDIQVLNTAEQSAGFFFKHELDGLMRGDPLKRAESERMQFNTGSLTPNEIRAQNERNALDNPEADQPWVQVNLIPMSQAQSLTVDERAILMHGYPGNGGESVAAPGRTGGMLETRATPIQVARERRRIVRSFLPLLIDAYKRMILAEQQNVKRGLRFLDEWVSFLDEYYRNEMPELLTRLVAPAMESMALQIADAAAREVDSDFMAEDIQNWMLRPETGFVAKAANRYSMSSRTQLQRIAENAEDVETDTLQRFTEWDEGTDQGRPRAERWGQREAGRLGNAVAVEVWAVSGIVLMRWNTVGKTCPMCQSLDGNIVGIRDSFVQQGETVTGTDNETTIKTKTPIRHPPLHGGCDCFVSAA